MTSTNVRRRFLDVGSRRVHYRRAGEGPPVVLIHSSPANSSLLAKEIDRLARDFSVFAFDTPGFGQSDPLPLATMTVADLADAMAEMMVAAGLPSCPVFGTHTGASIALELGVRHPERVTGLVLDGLAAFTPDECTANFSEYFRKLPISDLGGHYADIWTRFRDQSIWFPWTARDPAALNEYDLSPPHSTHLWAQMYFDAADSYAPAYQAAMFHGAKAVCDGMRALEAPAILCATETDMLHPHLSRLPPLKPQQRIVGIGSSYREKRELIARSFAEFGSDGPAPQDRAEIGSSIGIARQFVDGSSGQIHLRFAGIRSNPPLLLLHDAPGSSEQAEQLILELAASHFVIAPDVPGNGASAPFASSPTIRDFAAEALHLLEELGVERATVRGIGFGASVALAIADQEPERVTELIVQGLPLPNPDERQAMLDAYAPPIEIEPDGAHWYRTWLMLRDGQVYFPWYDRRRETLRRAPADLSARRLHRWTVDVMRSRTSYGDLIRAALEWDAETALAATSVRVTLIADPTIPLGYYDNRIAVVRQESRHHDTASAQEASLPI